METKSVILNYILWIVLGMIVLFNIYWFLIRDTVFVIESQSTTTTEETTTQQQGFADPAIDRETYVSQQKTIIQNLNTGPDIKDEEVYVDAQLEILKRLEQGVVSTESEAGEVGEERP